MCKRKAKVVRKQFDESEDADDILKVGVTRSCEDHIDSLFQNNELNQDEELTAPISSTYLSKRKA